MTSTVNYNGVTLKVVEQNGCEGCFFDAEFGCSVPENDEALQCCASKKSRPKARNFC